LYFDRQPLPEHGKRRFDLREARAIREVEQPIHSGYRNSETPPKFNFFHSGSAERGV